MKTYCLALDLKDNAAAIKTYEDYHRAVWPEIIESIHSSGIVSMKIYRTGNRLFMIMETTETFSFEEKSSLDASNPKVQEWETLMNQFQQRLPWSKPDEKWVLMEEIFSTER